MRAIKITEIVARGRERAPPPPARSPGHLSHPNFDNDALQYRIITITRNDRDAHPLNCLYPRLHRYRGDRSTRGGSCRVCNENVIPILSRLHSIKIILTRGDENDTRARIGERNRPRAPTEIVFGSCALGRSARQSVESLFGRRAFKLTRPVI